MTGAQHCSLVLVLFVPLDSANMQQWPTVGFICGCPLSETNPFATGWKPWGTQICGIYIIGEHSSTVQNRKSACKAMQLDAWVNSIALLQVTGMHIYSHCLIYDTWVLASSFGGREYMRGLRRETKFSTWFFSYLELQSIYIVITVKLYKSYCDFGLILKQIWCY